MDIKSGLEKLSKLTYQDVGISEENVKQKIVVPLLELFGHNRNDLDFEYGSQGKRIDIFIKGLPQDCKVFIDTKKYNEDLSNHIEQISLYAFQEGAILALIINGEELRIYDPFFRGYSMRDSLLYSIKRKDFGDEESIKILEGLLLKKNILNKSIKQLIERRELELIEANNKIELIKIEAQKQIDRIQNDIKNLSLKTEQIKLNKQKQIQEIQKVYKLYQEEMQASIKNEHSEMQYYRTEHLFTKSSDKIEIILNIIHTPKTYSLIPLPKIFRHFFPGYKVEFELETDIGIIYTKVTSGRAGTKYGDPVAGAYVQGGLKKWYDAHPELKNGSILIISIIEPKKRYSLSIK